MEIAIYLARKHVPGEINSKRQRWCATCLTSQDKYIAVRDLVAGTEAQLNGNRIGISIGLVNGFYYIVLVDENCGFINSIDHSLNDGDIHTFAALHWFSLVLLIKDYHIGINIVVDCHSEV